MCCVAQAHFMYQAAGQGSRKVREAHAWGRSVKYCQQKIATRCKIEEENTPALESQYETPYVNDIHNSYPPTEYNYRLRGSRTQSD